MSAASSWGDTFGGLLSGIGDTARAVADTVSTTASAYRDSRASVEGRTTELRPIWSDEMIARQNDMWLNRGTVGTDAYLSPIATLTGEFSTTEIVLLFVAALAAGWAFTRF